MATSCVEQFGKDLTLYDIKNGSATTARTLLYGSASVLSKNFSRNYGNAYAFRFADQAFRGVSKDFVEECSERYRRFVPHVSGQMLRRIRDLEVEVGIITHDIHSLTKGVYEKLGFDLDDSDVLIDNDFTFYGNRVSGIELDQNGYPHVSDKAFALRDFMRKKGYKQKDVVLVGHGAEEISMAHAINGRVIVPERGSNRKLKENAMGTYKHVESLPEMVKIIFKDPFHPPINF